MEILQNRISRPKELPTTFLKSPQQQKSTALGHSLSKKKYTFDIIEVQSSYFNHRKFH